MKKRIEWIDTVKFICILFVMISHLGNEQASPYFLNLLFNPFFLTAFLFVSGYVYKQPESFRVHLYKKFRQLFVPWFVFSVFIILLSQVLTFRPEAHQSLWTDLMYNFLQIRMLKDEIWFVAALFSAYIPFYFFIKGYEKIRYADPKKAIIIYSVITVIMYAAYEVYYRYSPSGLFFWGTNSLPWHIEYIPFAMSFMYLGYMCRTAYEKYIDEFNTTVNFTLTCVVYIVLAELKLINAIYSVTGNSIIYHAIIRLLGIFVIVMLSKRIKSNRFISYIGQNTLICFALHGKVYAVMEKVIARLVPELYKKVLSIDITAAVYVITAGLLIAAVLIIPSYIINRFFPFIVGRKSDKPILKIKDKNTNT